MKREIKFRAFLNSKYYEKPRMLPWGELLEQYDEIDMFQRDLMTLMQYTGLHDKNGRAIYEGDIVSFGSVWNNGDDEDIDEEFHIGVVEYDPNYAVYNVNCEESGERHFMFMDVVNYDGFGVIGNIFENPELLDGKQ